MAQLIVDIAMVASGLLGFGFGLIFWFLVFKRVVS